MKTPDIKMGLNGPKSVYNWWKVSIVFLCCCFVGTGKEQPIFVSVFKGNRFEQMRVVLAVLLLSFL